MKLSDQVHELRSERPLFGVIAKVLFPMLAAGLIWYLGMFAHNVSNAKTDVAKAGTQAKELVATAATQLGPNLEWTVLGTKVGR